VAQQQGPRVRTGIVKGLSGIRCLHRATALYPKTNT
jgi:hypothetical protein